jgi:hypothetical protein
MEKNSTPGCQRTQLPQSFSPNAAGCEEILVRGILAPDEQLPHSNAVFFDDNNTSPQSEFLDGSKIAE